MDLSEEPVNLGQASAEDLAPDACSQPVEGYACSQPVEGSSPGGEGGAEGGSLSPSKLFQAGGGGLSGGGGLGVGGGGGG